MCAFSEALKQSLFIYPRCCRYFVIVDSSTFWYLHEKRYGQRMRRDTSHVRYVIFIPFMPISFEFFYDFALSCLALLWFALLCPAGQYSE